MIEPATIDKNLPLLPSQDYALLREQGLQYIQDLSGQIWTDHNSHDPGITTLEILCYALTDLGYRTEFDVKDLLTRPDGTSDPPEISGLFPAHEVLTTNPLTIHDYCRLLLKVEGVRNAWLDPMTDAGQQGNYRESEVPFHADCSGSTLTYQPTDNDGNPFPRVRLSGLYKVLLELEIDDVLGSLNESRMNFRIRQGPLKGVVISLDSLDLDFLNGDIDFGPAITGIIEVQAVVGGDKQYSTAVKIDTGEGKVLLVKLLIGIVNDRPVPSEDPVKIDSVALSELLDDAAPEAVIPLFWKKQHLRQRTIDTVCCVLHAHRNLCEDFLSVDTVSAERVAVCADVEVAADADLEEVQARVFFAIENHFNPPVRYYTLKELLDDGFGVDDIFNIPYIDPAFTCEGRVVFTKSGFVKTEDLDSVSLKRSIYVSDLINILMDLDDVVAIRNVMLRKCDASGSRVGPGEKWCLTITPNHQPLLDIDKSRILFVKNQLPYRARTLEFQQTLDHLRAMARKGAYVEPNQTLGLPRGRFRDPDAFFSIQHDYPQTYGVGEAGLPREASPERVARARQFKAYLTFYDQVLADYLAQLANLRRLISLDENVQQTYFSQFLAGIAGVRDDFAKELFIDENALKDETRRNRLTENESTFVDRRNRLLDHLMARFGEQFTDYVLLLFRLQGDRLNTGRQLVDDKIRFLRELPVLSRQRHKAFNFQPRDPSAIWNTNNVSGLEKRVCRLLSIDDHRRRDLACDALFDELFHTRKTTDGKFCLEVQDALGAAIFQSREGFADETGAMREARMFFPHIRREETYRIDTSGGKGSVTYRMEVNGRVLTHVAEFETESDAVRGIRAIIDRYDTILTSSEACNVEGFHLIEHILLRPGTENDELLEVCLSPDGKLCGEQDPYSFRVHVVLPYWPQRFQNLDFRRVLERTLREEAPAHVHVRVCWIGNEQMERFDRRYREWLEAKAGKDLGQKALTKATSALIQILQQLKTVYPAAMLHDCEEGQADHSVRLDNTNLGVF